MSSLQRQRLYILMWILHLFHRNVVVDVPIVADANVALDKLNEWAEPEKDC